MKPKFVIKIIADIAMTVILILLMTYELVGQAAHEWLGCAMFALFVIHHILNLKWTKNLFKGKYSAFRIAQTVIAVLVLAAMLGSMISGIMLSRNVFSFLKIRAGRSFARNLHMVCGYAGYVLMSLHLGLHWSIAVRLFKKLFKKTSNIRAWTARIIAAAIAGYGGYAFFKRGIGGYMLLINRFAFFDHDEPLILFILDYIAVLGTFVFIGYYLTKLLQLLSRRRKNEG